MLPRSLSEVGSHYAALERMLVDQALEMLQPTLQRGRRSPEAWRDAVQSIATRLWTLQVAAASYADAYLNDVLDAQDAAPTAEAQVNPAAFADLTDGGGSWVQALVFAPNSVRPTNDGDWSRFGFVANSIVKTGLGDTARASVQSGMQARPSVKGYVRMLRGTSCARCAILAARRYRSSVAFNRHKRCDCIHVPDTEDTSGDWTTDPKAYFNSLTADDQDRLFTKAGAEAIRLGADPAQVVNARKGITVVTAFGQNVLATLEGTTRRGVAGQRLIADGARLQGESAETVRRRSREGVVERTVIRQRVQIPRLMPEQIFQLAERFNWDRAETLRQLRRFAYVL